MSLTPGQFPTTNMPLLSNLLRQAQSSQMTAEKESLEFEENYNKTWRSQFTDPKLAIDPIGIEFAPLPDEAPTTNDEAANLENGNINVLSRTLSRRYRL